MQVVLDEENTSQERQLQASEISHFNLHDVCSLCADVAPCQKAGAGRRGGWGGSGYNCRLRIGLLQKSFACECWACPTPALPFLKQSFQQLE